MTTPKTKVIHTLSKDKNGDSAITSKTVSKPKDNHKTKEGTKPPAPVKAISDLSDEALAVLKTLHDLGGKDVHSMDIAKKLGFDKKYPKAPRGPVRNAMEKLHALHFVTSKKEGTKYSFSITD